MIEVSITREGRSPAGRRQDLSQVLEGKGGQDLGCGERVGRYITGEWTVWGRGSPRSGEPTMKPGGEGGEGSVPVVWRRT